MMRRTDARIELPITDRLLARFAGWDAFSAALEVLRRGSDRIALSGLTGSARALALACVAAEAARPILCLAPNREAVEEIREDLAFLLGRRAAAVYPDTGEDAYAAHHDPRGVLQAQRTEILCALALRESAALPLFADLRVVVSTPRAWIGRVPTIERTRGTIVTLEVGATIDPDRLAHRLVEIGYEMNPLVGEYGDASRRGGIVDIYSLGRENPIRIEFDGDEIESIREFDVFTQRSVSGLRVASVLPASLFVPDQSERAAAAEAIRAAEGRDDSDLVDLVREEPSYDGVEWLAGFYGIPLVSPNGYLPEPRWTVVVDPAFVEAARDEAWEDARRAYEAAAAEGGIVSPPEDLFDREIMAGAAARIDLGRDESAGRSVEEMELCSRPAERFGRNLDLTRAYIGRLRERGDEIQILCDTDAHRERLAELLHPVAAEFHVGNLSAGFEIPELRLTVLTDHEIFARTRRRSAMRRFTRGISLKELLALGPGDYVVHIDHGIGIYRGMTRLRVSGQETDCMTLDYAGGDKLYVPVDRLDLVQRYSAEEGHRPTLSRLGSPAWEKTKSRIKRRIRDMAEELLRTAAIRRSRPGHAFSRDTDAQSALELSFPYEETADQLTAITDVKTDMETGSPMDRLVCGDVGFGKTEVAIRAAFKAAMDGKQTAVLVPTTLLAEQHYETFGERLADFPVRVEMLSRFRNTAEQKAIVNDLKTGKIDIVVGTHRLVQKDISFRDLGLLVIDEEHRFGVAQKERLKKIRETVDILSLTATPIPRTLHLALAGGRDMSTIHTPPRDRRPIKTEIAEFRDDLIAHALMKETDRGGQSFFVHNRIESIDAMANYITRLVPHLRIAVGHGKMREIHLERIMKAFLEREYDVLVSTTIIESGLDFPNVNTILINRGDMFGLAQLYQLRGRVGRSSREAYAYLLVPPYRSITEQAQKRLKAIEEFGDLGSGFQLAMRDLEIRGAGNLLGAEQHGFILNVGFDLYCHLLDETVRELKGVAIEPHRDARVVTDLEAYLPDEYVLDHREKMTLYKSIADTKTVEDLAGIEEEIRDRFGPIPPPGRNLFDLRRVRLLAGDADVETATVTRDSIAFEFRRRLTRGDIQRLAESPVRVEFHTPAHGSHRVRCAKIDVEDPVAAALRVLQSLLRTEIPFPSAHREPAP